jgi:hypothetical protein
VVSCTGPWQFIVSANEAQRNSRTTANSYGIICRNPTRR